MKKSETPESFRNTVDDYHEQLTWLESLITDPSGSRYAIEKSPAQRLEEYHEQIQRMGDFLDYLGNPQERYRSVHVAGTSGKGSVTTMVGALLRESGAKTGVHTSPYLQIPNEKLVIDRKMIAPSRLSQLIQGFRPKYQQFTEQHKAGPPRYGEAWVALTYQYFAEELVDWAVIETGMGERFDPTNVLHPEVAIVTNVGMDHIPQLGTNISEIAFHKAGVIKPRKPLVTGEQKPKALEVIRLEAEKKNAPLFQLGKDFSVRVQKTDQQGSLIDITTPFHKYRKVRLGLTGTFQPENAAIAVSSVDILMHSQNASLSKTQVERALEGIVFPGRMERIQEKPTVILDGAHNPEKMIALAESLRAAYPEQAYTLIIGMLATKDAQRSVSHIIPHARKIIATEPHVYGKPGVPARRMKQLIASLGPEKEVSSTASVSSAIRRALKDASPQDLIVITGSLYLLGEARNFWISPDQLLLEAEYGASS